MYVSLKANIFTRLIFLLLFALYAQAADFMSPSLTPEELLDRLDSEDALLVIDVRKPAEFAIAHVPGARNIPLDEIEEHLDEFRGETGVLVYCINGARTRQAEPLFYNNGIENVYHLEGALQGWIQDGHPIEKGGVNKAGW